ncbi:hypothetical protein [Sorangium sp. So ce1078]|uniref:hypothetical protein n=1 Tax=Sorangium sp. So ce1078 TaxID=3133329 RepID=UPI003F60223B
MEQPTISTGSARDADLKRAIAETVARLGKPVTPAEARKALPKPYQRPPAELSRLLDELAASRVLFAVPSGKSRRFLDRDPERSLRDAILAALKDGPLTKPELTKRVKAAAPGLDKGLAAALAALRKSGAVREHPKAGKTSARYALYPPDPAPFLGGAMREVKAALKKLAPHGVSLAAVYEALGRALGVEAPAAARAAADGALSDDEAVLRAVRELAARETSGALLPVRAVRAALPLDKGRFDRAALRLAAGGALVLQHHDYPASLSAEERAALVVDDHGTHYARVAPRRDDQ